MGEIIIPGFPTGMLVPGIYINVELGRQPPSAAGAVRKVLLVGQNPSTGITPKAKADPGVLYPISRLRSKYKATDTQADPRSAEDLFGIDTASPTNTYLYWMAKAAFAANALVSLYAIKVEAGGTWDYEQVLDPENGPAVAQQFHYIAMDNPVSGVPYSVSHLIKYLESLAAPVFGIRQQGIVGGHGVDVPGEQDPRSARLQYVWSPQGDSAPSEEDFKKGKFYYRGMLAAAAAAARSRNESVDPACNLCMVAIPGVPTPPAENSATKSDLNTAISKGITPLVTQGTDTCFLRSVTTVANVESNTYPVLDTSKVTVTDFVADDIEMKMINRYTGFKLAPDTDIPPPSMTATPKGIKSSLVEWLREHEKAGRITIVTDLSERVIVEIDEEVPGRVNFQIPEDVIEIFAVGAGNIIQIG